MSTLPQVVADLLAAREVLAVRGLAKHALQDDEGRVCSIQAFRVEGVRSPGVAQEWLRRVIDRWSIAGWNNAPERTQAEVLAAFSDAASLALSEAAARGDYE